MIVGFIELNTRDSQHCFTLIFKNPKRAYRYSLTYGTKKYWKTKKKMHGERNKERM